ncbi:hypothetical protein ACP70R_030634 [Stipagrostis hirtigluma subsp. patula]
MEESDVLLPKVPAVVPVDKKMILDSALKKLSLVIERQETSRLGSREFLSTIVLAGFIDKDTLMPESRTFHGVYAETEELAMSSVYDAVLGHLQSANMIVIHDVNYQNLVKTKKALNAADTWSMLFESALANANKKIAARDSVAAQLLASIEAVCDAHRLQLPVQLTSYVEPNGAERVCLLYNGAGSPSTPLDVLAKLLVDVHAQLQSSCESGAPQP